MVLAILNELAATSSKLDKAAILARNKTNVQLMQFFAYCLDPSINYYVAKRPKEAKAGKKFKYDNYSDLFMQVHSKLSGGTLRGHAARDYLIEVYANLDEDGATVLDRILERSPECGVLESTVNDCWENLIPEFPCMLATALDKVDPETLGFPHIVEQKMDGGRAETFVFADGRSPEFYSRVGKMMHLKPYTDKDGTNLYEAIQMLHFEVLKDYRMKQFDDIVFDGEILADNDGGYAKRTTGNGLIGKAVKDKISVEESARMRYCMWDIIPLDHFKEGFWSMVVEARSDILKCAIDRLQPKYKKYITFVRSILATCNEEADAMYEEIIAAGGEGTIRKILGSPWENKRAKTSVKVKKFDFKEFEVIGTEEGTKPNTRGKVGALLVKDASGKVLSGCGSGLSMKQRADWFSNPSLIVGKIVTIRYADIVKDKNNPGVWALFSPSLKEVRHDKTKADDLSKECK